MSQMIRKLNGKKHTKKAAINNYLSQGEAQNEYGNACILNARFDGNGQTIFAILTQQLGNEPSEQIAQARQAQTGNNNLQMIRRCIVIVHQSNQIRALFVIYLVREQLKQIQIGDNCKNNDKDDKQCGECFQHTDENARQPWQVFLNK